MKIGVLTDNFLCPLTGAIKKASRLGLAGVQIYAVSEEFNASLLKNTAKLDEYLKLLKDSNLVISALCGDMGGHGFEIAGDNPERIEKSKAIIDLAAACGTRVITTHIGVIPDDEKSEKFAAMVSALDALGSYGKKQGITLAIETGPEKPETLKKFIDHTHGGVGVNLDPANFVMVTDVDPAKAVEILGKHIVHTHVKDGIMKKKADPRLIYDFFANGGIGDMRMADYFVETPVGKGSVDFDAYINALKNAGYDGFFTIEREAGPDPEKDIESAAVFIKSRLEAGGYK
ncbi:sugar phosphate isomerase/epimerase family protein [Leadbettera azotonutricia]|uniref:AP endonuclease, family 2 n=1 Tax=Leadbettera azotonutricia (strain ATCC BAA-888 / DSM 13862 / ZAS-9) TaxID=545695 RepID=F5YFB9_LEAAZ|nr:sugar phosphate isomerase/epimerase [Leadbettera azotonutricia]AEF81106.1 AP endonuclease, family 2 [Leadbettera azotonutricia ZAS-9]